MNFEIGSPKPLYSQNSTQAPLVESLHTAILDLCSCPGLTTIEKHRQNSSHVNPDLGTGPDITVVPDPTEHTECTICLPYPDTQLLVDGTIRGHSRTEIGKIGHLLNRIALHRNVDRIRLRKRTLVKTLAYPAYLASKSVDYWSPSSVSSITAMSSALSRSISHSPPSSLSTP
jgi:hypothetical protein